MAFFGTVNEASACKEIGPGLKLVSNAEKVIVSWTITNFALHNKAEARIISPPFLTPSFNCSEEWFLVCWPNGTKSGSSYVGFALYSKNKIEISYRVKVKDSSDSFSIKSDVVKFDGNIFSGLPSLFQRSRLFQSSYPTVLINNALTVYFVLKKTINPKSDLDAAITMQQNNTLSDILHMFNDKNLGDVEIYGKDCKITAHKCILSARSDVFKAMFNCDMKENSDCIVRIDGLDDDVIEDMLHYIYTGSSPRLSEVAERLVVAADRYGLEGLKDLCQLKLIENLNEKNVLTLFSSSVYYRLEKLKKACTILFEKEISCISKTSEFKEVIGTPELSKELLRSFAALHQVSELETLPLGSPINSETLPPGSPKNNES